MTDLYSVIIDNSTDLWLYGSSWASLDEGSYLPLALSGCCCCFENRWKFLGCPQGAFHFTIPSTTWVVFFTILKHRHTSLRLNRDRGKVELFGDLICPSTSVESMPSPFSSECPLWNGYARNCYQYSKHRIHDSVSLFYIHVISFDSMTDLYSVMIDNSIDLWFFERLDSAEALKLLISLR